MSCKYMGFLVNQGYWWCNLKDEKGKQVHPSCDCSHCKDKSEDTSTMTISVSCVAK